MVTGVSRYHDESCSRITSESYFEECAPGIVHEQGRDKKVFIEHKNESKIDFTFLIYLSNSDVNLHPLVIWVMSWLSCVEECYSCRVL